MSRNFELLAQIEAESNAPASILPFTASATLAGDAPALGSNGFQDEMLRLVQRVFLSSNGSAPRQVVFCGVQDGNGSTAVCAKAARVLASCVSKSVCVVDGNLKSPGLADSLELTNTISIFEESPSLNEGCAQIQNNLWFGGPDVLSAEIDRLPPVDQLKERLAQLRGAFDFVLIDAPGTNVCEDASILGQLADAAILVIDANRTRRLTAKKAMQALEVSGAKLLGTVLHDRSFPIPEKLYKRL